MTDEEFQEWLRDLDEPRALLIEQSYLDGGIAGKLYFSNYPYASGPEPQPLGQGPYNQPYDDVLVSDLEMSRRMSEAFTGQSTVERGDYTIANDGSRDDLLGYWFKGQKVKIYLGSPGWARDEFRLIADYICDGIQASLDDITFKIRDKSQRLNKPFVRPELNAGPTPEAKSPLLFGKVFNAKPALIDVASHRWQIHPGAVAAISEARDNGIVISDTPNLSAGYTELVINDYGEITLDVERQPSSCMGVAQDILTNYAGIGVSEIDGASVSSLEASAPFTVGLYVDSDQTMLAALDQVMSSAGGYWHFNRLGVFKVGRLNAPTGSPIRELFPDDIAEDGLQVRREIEPAPKLSIGYQKNHTVQTGSVANLVADDFKERLGREYSSASAENGAVPGLYPDAVELPETPTLLVNQADAQSEANRRAAINAEPHRVYEVAAFGLGLDINLGDEIRIHYPGHGFENGLDCIVVAVRDRPAFGETILEIWV